MSKKYIDADALREIWVWGTNDKYGYSECIPLKDLDDFPAADVRENVKGKWNIEHGVMMHDDIYGDLYRCSECGHWERDVDGHNFCLNCGADMRGQSE